VHASAHPDWSLRELCERAGVVGARLRAGREEARALLTSALDSGTDRDVLERLTRCRSVGLEGSWSSELPATPADAWHHAWSARRHAYAIVYGHWALQGLHVAPDLRGLDTGCVHHGRGRDGYLTAWVPSRSSRSAPFSVPDDDFLQVRARRRYYDSE
jgi:hypothetical protein